MFSCNAIGKLAEFVGSYFSPPTIFLPFMYILYVHGDVFLKLALVHEE